MKCTKRSFAKWKLSPWQDFTSLRFKDWQNIYNSICAFMTKNPNLEDMALKGFPVTEQKGFYHETQTI